MNDREGALGPAIFQTVPNDLLRSFSLSPPINALNLPVIIEIVDSAETIESLLPYIDEMVQEELVTLEKMLVTDPEASRGYLTDRFNYRRFVW